MIAPAPIFMGAAPVVGVPLTPIPSPPPPIGGSVTGRVVVAIHAAATAALLTSLPLSWDMPPHAASPSKVVLSIGQVRQSRQAKPRRSPGTEIALRRLAAVPPAERQHAYQAVRATASEAKPRRNRDVDEAS